MKHGVPTSKGQLWVTKVHDALHVSTNTHLFLAYTVSFCLHVLFQLVHDNNFKAEKVLFGSFFSAHQLPQNKYSWTTSQVMRHHFYQLMKLGIKINVLSS